MKSTVRLFFIKCKISKMCAISDRSACIWVNDILSLPVVKLCIAKQVFDFTILNS